MTLLRYINSSYSIDFLFSGFIYFLTFVSLFDILHKFFVYEKGQPDYMISVIIMFLCFSILYFDFSELLKFKKFKKLYQTEGITSIDVIDGITDDYYDNPPSVLGITLYINKKCEIFGYNRVQFLYNTKTRQITYVFFTPELKVRFLSVFYSYFTIIKPLSKEVEEIVDWRTI